MMLGVSFCRNEKPANVFYRLHLIEAYGIGMGKIMGAYEASAARPLVRVSSGAFKIILPNMNQPLPEPETTYSMARESSMAQESTLSTEQALLELFKRNKKLTRPRVEEALGMSISSARRYLQKLIQSGYIVCEDQGKNTVYVLVDRNR